MSAIRRHGATTRRPVYTGRRRIPGLLERTLATGETVYEGSFRVDGKMRRFRFEARTKTDAIAELAALRVDLERGEVHRSSAAAATVADVAANWLAHLRVRVHDRDPRRRYSARTVELYEQRLERHVLPVLGPRPVAAVTVADVRKLADRLSASGLSGATVVGILNVVAGVMRLAVRGGLAERNAVRDLDRDDRPAARRQTEPRYLTAAELDRLLERLSPTFRPVVAACTFAGLRVSEALGLRWRDVDLTGGTLTVSGQLGPDGTRAPTKTRASAATVPLLPALARELREHRSRQASVDLGRVHGDALVFQTARARPQSRRNALRAVHAAGDAAGLNGEGREPVGLHDLRHSFVALALVEGNVSLPEVARLARHANPRVTAAVYGGLADTTLDGAASKLVAAGFGV